MYSHGHVMSLQLNLSWEHQEETVAGCNTLTSFMAVVYTGMATAVLTGWLNKFYTNPEKWHLALSTSSFWMGAMYIQSGIVSHGYLAQVGTTCAQVGVTVSRRSPQSRCLLSSHKADSMHIYRSFSKAALSSSQP